MTWQPIATAKKDGRLLLLLVAQNLDCDASHHPTEDELVYRTIGLNNFENDGEDVWQFAGWSWEHDRFVQGRGTPTHWQGMPDAQVVVDFENGGKVSLVKPAPGQLGVPLITRGEVAGLPRIAVDGVFVRPGTLSADPVDDDDRDGAA